MMKLALIHDGRVLREATAGEAALPHGPSGPLFDIRDVSGVSGIAVGWLANEDGTFSAPPPPPLDILSATLLAAGIAASGSITRQIAASETHLAGYASAANLAQIAGGVPTADPAKSAFAALASAVGLSPPKLATLVIAMDAASVQSLAILATLQGSVAKAKSASDLAAALKVFEASLAAFLVELNGMGLTGEIIAPDAILIPGINA